MEILQPLIMRDIVTASFGTKKLVNPKLLSPLVLAYVGDTIYDLFVRSYLICSTTRTAHGLHELAIRLVCASSQANAFHSIEHLLSEEEFAIFKRGRNAHNGTVPKSASIADYRTATGFETLLGFLYLSGDDSRLVCLMRKALEVCDVLNTQ